jgi:hypothetical protein
MFNIATSQNDIFIIIFFLENVKELLEQKTAELLPFPWATSFLKIITTSFQK